MEHEDTPWYFGDVSSHNGEMKIEYENLGEAAMGAPWSGVAYFVKVNSGVRHLIHERAGGPAVWSEDDRYVILPIWLSRTMQHLGLFDTDTRRLKFSFETFDVVHLKRFHDGRIEGTIRFYSNDKPFSYALPELFS